MKPILPALVLLLLGAGVVAGVRAALRGRRDGGEHGDVWARTVLLTIVVLAPPTLLSGWLEVLRPTWWHSGRHLYLDLTGAFGWPISTCYLVSLALPFGVWLAVLATAAWRAPEDDGRWLAGGVGFSDSRRWVLLCVLPALAVMAWALPRLGGGPGAYPGAAWSTFAVVCLSLVGVAWSTGSTVAESAAAESDQEGESETSRPWPVVVEEAGLHLRHLAAWPGIETPRSLQGAGARDLAERLRLVGARNVAPELVETLDDMLSSDDGKASPARLVLAPDGCGQLEVIALAAHLLERRSHAHTLVITAGDSRELADRFERWLAFRSSSADEAGPRGAVAVTAATDVVPRELVWVTDAGTLSDRLLPQLQDPRRVERIGLVVWWDVHDYTGVLAANLWAISRRLHRLLRAYGRGDVRTLALLRAAPHEDAQLTRFVRRLLPLPADTPEVHVAVRNAKPVDVHLVESHHGFLTGAGQALEPRWQHLPLAAALLSAEKGWDTCFEVPPELRDQAHGLFDSLRGTPHAQRLRAVAAEAGVHVYKLDEADVLSLAEMFSQGGRANGSCHHVGLIRPDNPYAAHLLDLLARQGGNGSASALGTSRRLISAEARDRVIHRHLVLALSELPDTRGELLKSFLRNEEVLERTLGSIAAEGNLTRREVRHLDTRGRLVIDHQYRSRRLGDRAQRPLDTVGTDLVEVRDPTGDGDGVCLRLDPERLSVEAYPQRVFLHEGRRYRVRQWDSPEEVRRRGWVACERHDVYSHTWRLRQCGLYDIDPDSPQVTVGGRGKSFTRRAAEVSYEEEVTGVVRVAPPPSSTRWPLPETRAYEPIRTSFATRALLLGLPYRPRDGREEERLRLAAVSLCQALRHVMPVHLGVREDDLELVPLHGYETPDGTFGLAVVDLYPGGIGLVDGLEDDGLLETVLRRTHGWLASCKCRGAHACCLATPSAKAAAMDYTPHHEAARQLLEQIV